MSRFESFLDNDVLAPHVCGSAGKTHRGGGLTDYVAIEARNLAPLPGDVDFTVGASLPMPGLTAWQGFFEHGRLQAGQSVLVQGAADRQKALDFGAMEFVDLENDAPEEHW